MKELEERYYSVAEVAKIFSVHPETVKLWVNGKQSFKMHAHKERGRWLISHHEIRRIANLKYGG
jgi:transposase